MSVCVTSEIGRLERVIVHTPGPELLAVTPETREHYLYDDIIHIQTAQTEHRRFVAVLERFATVLQVRDLLNELLQQPEPRERLIAATMDVIASEAVARELRSSAPGVLVQQMIEGREEPAGPLARTLNESGYSLPPLPNLFFTRDVSMVLGEHVMIGSMRYNVRWTEELLMKALFSAHPTLANRGILYDGAVERRVGYTLEGGDVHPLRRDLVMIGFSERSSPAAIDHLAAKLFSETEVTDVIVVVMPRENAAIHLDMIFTQVDRELAVLYPPHFVGPERLPILHWHKGESTMRETSSVFAALKECGAPIEPIFCGGERRVLQEREQWASGCNMVALRPGLVLSYARNEATLREMEKTGFEVVPAGDFLTGQRHIAESQRAVITFPGSELVRGGGGPRCMTCPIGRDDPWT
jgi:arginine deiminase